MTTTPDPTPTPETPMDDPTPPTAIDIDPADIVPPPTSQSTPSSDDHRPQVLALRDSEGRTNTGCPHTLDGVGWHGCYYDAGHDGDHFCSVCGTSWAQLPDVASAVARFNALSDAAGNPGAEARWPQCEWTDELNQRCTTFAPHHLARHDDEYSVDGFAVCGPHRVVALAEGWTDPEAELAGNPGAPVAEAYGLDPVSAHYETQRRLDTLAAKLDAIAAQLDRVSVAYQHPDGCDAQCPPFDHEHPVPAEGDGLSELPDDIEDIAADPDRQHEIPYGLARPPAGEAAEPTIVVNDLTDPMTVAALTADCGQDGPDHQHTAECYPRYT